MANWNNPALTSLYIDFLTQLKERDDDAIKMNPVSNFPVDSKRWNAPTNTFQVWNGAAWVNLVIGAAGGGTGSGSGIPAFGTMAAQNANAVAITGGTITGVALNAGDITAGILALNRGGTGASLALGASGSFLQSNGAQVVFGVNGAALVNLNASAINAGNLPMAHMPTGGTWNLSGALEVTAGSYQRINGGSGFIVGAGLAAMGAGTINATAFYISGVPFVPSTGGGIPAGMMAYFDGGCPPGWTFVNASGGRVVKSILGGAGLQGGANTHIHSINSSTLDASPNVTSAMDVGSVSRSLDGGGTYTGYLLTNPFNHQHNFTHSHPISVNSDPGDSWAPFVEYMLCMKN